MDATTALPFLGKCLELLLFANSLAVVHRASEDCLVLSNFYESPCFSTASCALLKEPPLTEFCTAFTKTRRATAALDGSAECL